LDDIIIIADSAELAEQQARELVESLEALGIAVSEAKSVLTPSQSIEYLGVLIDSLSMSFMIPNKKRRSARNQVRALLRARESSGTLTLQVRRAASLVGLLNSFADCVSTTRRRTAALQRAKNDRLREGASYTDLVTLPAEAIAEIEWWVATLSHRELCSAPIQPLPPTHVITTDASGRGWGGALWTLPSGLPATWTPDPVTINASVPTATASGVFTAGHRAEAASINQLETEAAALAVSAFSTQLAGAHVILATDNSATCAYLNRQRGRFRHIEAPTLRFHDLLAAAGVASCRVMWTPGETNTVSDLLSRRAYDASDYAIRPEVLALARDRWGSCDVDLFASIDTAQVATFASLRPAPGRIASDAFDLDWNRFRLPWIHPPIGLIPRVLSKLRAERVTALVVVPRWASRPWWPVLLTMSRDRLTVAPGRHFQCADRDHPFAGSVPWALEVHLVAPAALPAPAPGAPRVASAPCRNASPSSSTTRRRGVTSRR
jgi:hypothetical protein